MRSNCAAVARSMHCMVSIDARIAPTSWLSVLTLSFSVLANDLISSNLVSTCSWEACCTYWAAPSGGTPPVGVGSGTRAVLTSASWPRSNSFAWQLLQCGKKLSLRFLNLFGCWLRVARFGGGTGDTLRNTHKEYPVALPQEQCARHQDQWSSRTQGG